MTGLRTVAARRDFLARIEETEGPDARQRLADAFSAWWLVRHPDQQPSPAP